MLQADVSIDADLACRIYESCKSVAIVGETTAMQSGLVSTVYRVQCSACMFSYWPTIYNKVCPCRVFCS